MQVIGLLTLLLSCEVVVVVGMEEVLANDGVGGGLVHAAATLATGGHRITAAAAVGATSTMVSAWKKYFKKNNGGETSDSDDDDVDMLDESGASVETLKEINQPCSCWTKLVGRGRYGFFSNTFKNNHRKFEVVSWGHGPWIKINKKKKKGSTDHYYIRDGYTTCHVSNPKSGSGFMFFTTIIAPDANNILYSIAGAKLDADGKNLKVICSKTDINKASIHSFIHSKCSILHIKYWSSY